MTVGGSVDVKPSASCQANNPVWSIVSGALPAGVALGVVDGTNIGVIAGTPTEAGPYAVTVSVTCGYGQRYSSQITYSGTVAAAASTVAASAPASVTSSEVLGRGTVTPNGSAVSSVECRVVSSVGGLPSATVVPATPSTLGADAGPTAVTCALSELTPNQRYVYDLVATNGIGTTTSASVPFVTGAAPPIVSAGAATAVSQRAATGNGTVTATNESVSEIRCAVWPAAQSPSAAVTAAATPASAPDTSANLAVTCDFAGLASSTAYAYTVSARDEDDWATTAPVSFATTAWPAPPAPSPTPTPDPAPTPAVTPTTTASAFSPVDLGGGLSTAPGAGARRLPWVDPSRTRRDAPVVVAPVGSAVRVRAEDLAPRRAWTVSVDAGAGWHRLAVVTSTRAGRLVLPAVVGSHAVRASFRLTTPDRATRWIVLRVRG